MKTYLITLAFLIFSAAMLAQDVFSNKVNSALEKVLRDFPNRFHNIKGEVIEEGKSATEYRSTVQVPGANTCIVIRATDTKKDVYSWSCTALRTEVFIEAKNKFREIYGQIENTIMKIDGGKPFIITGQYETPSEDKKETTILFELLPAAGELKKLRVGLSLQSELKGWKVSLSVSDNDRKEDGQGAITDN
jgi:hypothetical protein